MSCKYYFDTPVSWMYFLYSLFYTCLNANSAVSSLISAYEDYNFVFMSILGRKFSVYVATLLRATKHLFPTEILTFHLCKLKNVRLSEFPLTACFQN